MTHINAFEQELEAAKQAVVLAQGKVEQAELALRAHPDFKETLPEEVEPEAEQPQEAGKAEDVPVKVKKTKN